MAFTCTFLFHGNLNDFLLNKQKEQWVSLHLKGPASIKDAIEAIGVPHVEVSSISVCGIAKPLTMLLQPADQVQVYPYVDQIPSNGPWCFVLDVHLGKLVRLLRLIGVDAYYRNDLDDPEIVAIATAQNRVVLTRDIGLLKHKVLAHGYWLRSQHSEEQLQEVVSRFGLCPHLQPFTRCIACNGLLGAVQKQDVLPLLPPDTARYFDEFYQCTGCRQVYWKGSHFEKMEKLVQRVLSVACQ